MKIVDLSHQITNDMTTYPGDVPATLESISSIEDGFRSTFLSFNSHSGTHIDAPAHILKEGKFLEEFSNEIFFGMGIVVDATNCATHEITQKDISEEIIKKIDYVDYILFRTDWSKKWNSNEYLSKFPVLSESLATYLTKLNIIAVGFDAISADKIDSEEMRIHKILLSADILIIENLCNLDKLGGEPFCMACLPLSFSKQDGSPARVMAILED